jgi:hypothetical protein
MRKKLIAIGSALALTLLTASTASALAYGDANYVGAVIDGIPPNDSNEPLYVNSLIQVAPGVNDPTCNLITSERCDRTGSTLAIALPAVDLTGQSKVESGLNLSILVNGWEYVSAKYGNEGIYVWYIGNLNPASTFTLQQSFGPTGGGTGISHYTLYNAGGTTVPDGGTTAALLGLSMVGLGMIRRRINL